MVKFEACLRRCCKEEWKESYMNYVALKSTLRAFTKRRSRLAELELQYPHNFLPAHPLASLLLVLESSSTSSPNAPATVITTATATTCTAEYFQYTDQQDNNNRWVETADARLRLSIIERDEFSARVEEEFAVAALFYNTQIAILQDKEFTMENTNLLAQDFLELTTFLVTNLITFRQALIRYNGFQRTFKGMPLAEWNLQRSLNPETLDFDQSLERKVLRALQEQGADTDEFSAQLQYLLALHATTSDRLARSVGGRVVLKDRVLSRLRFGLQSHGLAMEPKFLLLRGRNLKAEVLAVAEFRERSTQQSTLSRLEELEPANRLPLLLNLVACFLYMMNSYIIEPSSAYYADALGSSDAMSGIMIGAGPWFALASSVAYSFWTNYSYKNPTLFSGLLLMLGNLLYANAYSYRSMEMCLIGRAVTGLGAPRIINRRYVADATPFSLRTLASAAFSLATALGAALGPGMAILLDMVDFEFNVPLIGKQYFNGMTGPGYLMAACWGVYLVATLLTFKEPVRSGLVELKQREGISTATSTSLLEQGKSDELVDEEGDYEDDENASYAGSISTVATGENSNGSKDETNNAHCCGCIRHVTVAVVVCMSLIFMKRIALEGIIGSTSVVTKNRYSWSIQNVGTLHLVNGIIVIPVSALSGWLATFRQDRYLAICCLSITLVGILLLVDVTDFGPQETEKYNEGEALAVGPARYVAGSIIMFSGIEACESYVASLMSKVVPSALAVGTFNSGLLATLVGTGGRATGDAVITMMGLISIRHLLNLLVIPAAILVSFSMFLIRYNYDILGV